MMMWSAATVLAAQAADPDWLRPTYHFTRAAHHMNDPNGLMFTKGADGSITYHMFFQTSDPGQSLGSIWGHALSPDLVSWTRVARTGMRGSSGGGISLPSDFVPPAALNGAKAVAFNSVPMSPALKPATGLHLHFSTDEKLIEWSEYRDEAKIQNASNPWLNHTCVICPADVPQTYRPGYIGDNYAWREPAAGGGAGAYNFYVLTGSTRCSEGHPWCSYPGLGGNSTAQAFVFRSRNLQHWTLASNWDFLPKQKAWPAGFPTTSKSQWPGQRIDTPDVFPVVDADSGLADGSWAFVWLNDPAGCNTHWMIGSMSNDTDKTFTPSTKIGCADLGAMLCQQSLTTATGDRVSLGWIGIGGDGWDGAQSLPRVITKDQHGLAYAPLPALASLHTGYRFWRHHALPVGLTPLPDISKGAAHLHLRLEAMLVPSQALNVSLLGGAVSVTAAFLCAGGTLCPGAAQCLAGTIVNNSDTKIASPSAGGATASEPMTNTSAGPEWCRALCCANPACAAWTLADPMPGTNGTTRDCFMKAGGGAETFPSTCQNAPGKPAHCWSGLASGGGGGSWYVTVGGKHLGAVRPLGSGRAATAVAFDVFVDGAIVEVYFGGEVITWTGKAASQDVALQLAGGSGGGGTDSTAEVKLDAWLMNASVTGGPTADAAARL
jgi:hypothetical protein